MDLIPTLFGLAAGALGGNVAGGMMKSSMGTLGRSLTGILGGGGLATLAPMLGLGDMFTAPADAGFNMKGAIAGLVSGGVGGGILTAILGMLKK